MKIHIVRNKQIGPAVAVIIAESRSRGPPGIAAQSGGLGHIGKGSVAVVAIEHHAAKASYQQSGRPSLL